MLRTAIYLLFIFFALFFSDSSTADQLSENEFIQRKALLKSRYKDFYRHKEKSAKFLQTLEAGKAELKEERKKWQEAWELARKKRAERNKTTANRERLQAKWQQEQDKQQQLYREARKQYVKRRDQLKSMEAELRKIPEEEEYGLVYKLQESP